MVQLHLGRPYEGAKGLISTLPLLPSRLMVGRLFLGQVIEVRILARQPKLDMQTPICYITGS